MSIENNHTMQRGATIIWVVLALLLAGCGGATATVSPNQVQTEVAAALTATGAAATPTHKSTNTPAPTNTPAASPTPRATPTPRLTNTPRPTATPEIGTIDNPFPFGETVKLTQDAAEFEIQLMEVIRGDEAYRIVYRANMFNDSPPSGMEYVLVRVRVKLTGGTGSLSLSESDFVSVSNGQMFDYFSASVCCLKDAGYTELEANLLTIGAETEGWMARPVFIDDQYSMIALGIDSFRSDIDNGLFFALK